MKRLNIILSFLLLCNVALASFPINSKTSKVANSLENKIEHSIEKILDPHTKNENIALGFIIGFSLGIIGVALAYIISDNSDLRKGAWKGFAVSLITTLLLILFFVFAFMDMDVEYTYY
jgi:hypothetical protein